jgi:hypothetical protein
MKKILFTMMIFAFIANVSAQLKGYDFSGVDVDETSVYGLRYSEFVVPLVKAVQELIADGQEVDTKRMILTK